MNELQKQFLKDAIMHYAQSYLADNINIENPELFEQVSKELDLDKGFTEIMGGMV